jgi:hypothetical protein
MESSADILERKLAAALAPRTEVLEAYLFGSHAYLARSED